MKIFLITVLALLAGWFGHDYFAGPAKPVDYKPVAVVVQEGDTMEAIIHRVQREFDDNRDWRIIAYQAKLDNSLERFIYPGQFIILRMAVK